MEVGQERVANGGKTRKRRGGEENERNLALRGVGAIIMAEIRGSRALDGDPTKEHVLRAVELRKGVGSVHVGGNHVDHGVAIEDALKDGEGSGMGDGDEDQEADRR